MTKNEKMVLVGIVLILMLFFSGGCDYYEKSIIANFKTILISGIEGKYKCDDCSFRVKKNVDGYTLICKATKSKDDVNYHAGILDGAKMTFLEMRKRTFVELELTNTRHVLARVMFKYSGKPLVQQIKIVGFYFSREEISKYAINSYEIANGPDVDYFVRNSPKKVNEFLQCVLSSKEFMRLVNRD